LGKPILISLRKSSGLLVILLIVGVLVGLINSRNLPVWTARTKPVSSTTQPIKNTNQPVPQQFNSAYLEDNNKDYSSLTTEVLWKNLLAGFQGGKQVQIGLENALIERLREEPDNPIYEELLALFRQRSLEGFAQQVLVSILGEVGNYKSAGTLMSLVNEALLQEEDVKLAAFDAISKFSPELWHEHPNTELAPVFEAAWQTENAEFLLSIANVMASIGTPSTLKMFIETLTDNTNAERVDIVKQAMTNLVNPALIPKLADSLKNSATENVQLASGNALAHMGEIRAASALFNWSARVNAEKVDLVKQWFETAMNTTPEFVDYLETKLPTQKFAAPEIKQAISVVLAEVKEVNY
jgi:hypothetical protein